MSETKRYDALFSKQVSLASTLALCFGMLAGGGGLGTALTGQSVAVEVKVLRTELAGRLDRLSQQLDDHSERWRDHENRIRELEKRP